jgi:hypothetical protein
MWFLAWTRYNAQYTRIIASLHLEQEIQTPFFPSIQAHHTLEPPTRPKMTKTLPIENRRLVQTRRLKTGRASHIHHQSL